MVDGKEKWRPGFPRIRLLIPLARSISGDEYRALWQWGIDQLDGLQSPNRCIKEPDSIADTSAKDPSRLFYLPRKKAPDAEEDTFVEMWEGPVLDPDALDDGTGGTLTVAGLLERHSSTPTAKETASGTSSRWDGFTYTTPDDCPDLKSTLGQLDAGDRSTWLKVGGALRRTFSDEESAFELFDRWSAGEFSADGKPDNYAGTDDCRKTWDSLERDRQNPATLTTLRNMVGATFPRRDEWIIAAYVADNVLGRVVYDEGAPHVYQPMVGTYEPRDERAIKKAIGGVLSNARIEQGGDRPPKPVATSARFINGVRECLENQTACPGFFAGEKPGVAFRNGFLALDGQAVALRDKSTENRCRFALPMDYDPDADCPQWIESLRRAHGHRNDCEGVIQLLQEFAGALLFGLAPTYQRALMLIGHA